MTSKLYPNLR